MSYYHSNEQEIRSTLARAFYCCAEDFERSKNLYVRNMESVKRMSWAKWDDETKIRYERDFSSTMREFSEREKDFMDQGINVMEMLKQPNLDEIKDGILNNEHIRKAMYEGLDSIQNKIHARRSLKNKSQLNDVDMQNVIERYENFRQGEDEYKDVTEWLNIVNVDKWLNGKYEPKDRSDEIQQWELWQLREVMQIIYGIEAGFQGSWKRCFVANKDGGVPLLEIAGCWLDDIEDQYRYVFLRRESSQIVLQAQIDCSAWLKDQQRKIHRYSLNNLSEESISFLARVVLEELILSVYDRLTDEDKAIAEKKPEGNMLFRSRKRIMAMREGVLRPEGHILTGPDVEVLQQSISYEIERARTQAQKKKAKGNKKTPTGYTGFVCSKIEEMEPKERERFLSTHSGDSEFYDLIQTTWPSNYKEETGKDIPKTFRNLTSQAKSFYKKHHS